MPYYINYIDTLFLVEGTLEEPWYEMPPAVFTQEGPIKVATSPMENLLIEHPSMSVYSVISRTTSSPIVSPDTPPPSPDGWVDDDEDINIFQDNIFENILPAPPPNLSSSTPTLGAMSMSLNYSPEITDRSNIDELSRRVIAELQAIHNNRLTATDSNVVKIEKQLHSAQERAQQV
jgi:hypothetical protein